MAKRLSRMMKAAATRTWYAAFLKAVTNSYKCQLCSRPNLSLTSCLCGVERGDGLFLFLRIGWLQCCRLEWHARCSDWSCARLGRLLVCTPYACPSTCRQPPSSLPVLALGVEAHRRRRARAGGTAQVARAPDGMDRTAAGRQVTAPKKERRARASAARPSRSRSAARSIQAPACLSTTSCVTFSRRTRCA